ncbi:MULTISPECIES: protein translocase subunit SecD [unclassified Novosphingobium]|uniref:protein translocase subunit SecD n=1 Tax=unclassified Novosphingobium TaxID=2644732 RepID=UPI00086848C1|nr:MULTISPECIES: protein translocase subunit SecD [unclassified Novosphingobium]MBN9144247.1 protein translocase subunit SecD [Novosphingobium sp.]MDR6708420.1 preprotein translocase subunit SecD [Novosphingobium sp. 1748]NKJ01509.1 preprotein translocase subunit SecD [Novosphingobium sp. SG707]ODU81134.1 MAG: protein-export membrane protein SecD [Novosphingobium sp. SCN 63-17]OJX94945.1 MAG: protein-export membrane protein SecD [Novosphingobium sp. 63-713]
MLDFPRWKQLWYWALTLLCVAAAVPSIVSWAGGNWPSSLPNPKINLGLDLAGGSHLLLEANADQVVSQRLEGKEEEVRAALKKAGNVHYGDISTKGGVLSFMVASAAEVDAAREVLVPLTNGAGLSGKRDWDIQVVDTTRFVLTPTKEGIADAIDKAMETATEVVRKRIDAMGTREPTIIRQGADRIVVQVPGLSDPAALKALLGQTAKLEFKLVDQNGMAGGVAAPGDEIVPFANGQGAIAVKRLGGIKGDRLTNATQSFSQHNEAVVSITFDNQGGEQFARLTSQNVGKPFAIILDGKVLSAPNINEPIMGGSAQISGSFTVESANQLAIALRSGALPVDLKVVEERTVGPDLGADSIHKGMIAMVVGTALVVIFMAVTYGRFGIYANTAVIINVLMILGIMAVFNTTLTLPGIAGFVLTIGAAVDANVLINERIREERRRGRKVVQSVELGYKEASRTIFDANITHIIAAVLMFEFGSGPIKGFAVVLMIGIATSVFTAVFLTRMWVAGWLRRARPSDLHI